MGDLSNTRRRISHYVSILCADKQLLSGDRKATWEVPSDFKYVILSAKKADILKEYTWAYLKECGVPDQRIMIVVQNPDDYRDYMAAGIPEKCLVQIEATNYAEAFNRVFAPTTLGDSPLVAIDEVCVQMDDDIVGLLSVGRQSWPSGRPKAMQVINLDAVMMEQMAIMEVSGCNLAGFSPVDKLDVVLRDTVVHRTGDHLALRFVIGQVRIFRNQGLQIKLLNAVGKNDYELSCRYFQADGGVVRSPMAIRCRRYVGGVATQGHMAEALVLREHFPCEFPIAPKVHVGGTTAFKLASVTLGQEAMLEKLENTMRERLGDAVCKLVIKQVELEIVESKKLLSLKRKARKNMAESDLLPLLRQDYNALMIARYGDAFDSPSHMLPFPSLVFQGPGKGHKRVRSLLEEQDDCGPVPSAKICKAAPQKNSAHVVEARLRSSSEMLHNAMSSARNLAMVGDKYNAVADEVANTHQQTVQSRQTCVCKACGERGHYEKCCPLKGPRALETPYERQERYRASRRAKHLALKKCVPNKTSRMKLDARKKPARNR